MNDTIGPTVVPAVRRQSDLRAPAMRARPGTTSSPGTPGTGNTPLPSFGESSGATTPNLNASGTNLLGRHAIASSPSPPNLDASANSEPHSDGRETFADAPLVAPIAQPIRVSAIARRSDAAPGYAGAGAYPPRQGGNQPRSDVAPISHSSTNRADVMMSTAEAARNGHVHQQQQHAARSWTDPEQQYEEARTRIFGTDADDDASRDGAGQTGEGARGASKATARGQMTADEAAEYRRRSAPPVPGPYPMPSYAMSGLPSVPFDASGYGFAAAPFGGHPAATQSVGAPAGFGGGGRGGAHYNASTTTGRGNGGFGDPTHGAGSGRAGRGGAQSQFNSAAPGGFPYQAQPQPHSHSQFPQGAIGYPHNQQQQQQQHQQQHASVYGNARPNSVHTHQQGSHYGDAPTTAGGGHGLQNFSSTGGGATAAAMQTIKVGGTIVGSLQQQPVAVSVGPAVAPAAAPSTAHLSHHQNHAGKYQKRGSGHHHDYSHAHDGSAQQQWQLHVAPPHQQHQHHLLRQQQQQPPTHTSPQPSPAQWSSPAAPPSPSTHRHSPGGTAGSTSPYGTSVAAHSHMPPNAPVAHLPPSAASAHVNAQVTIGSAPMTNATPQQHQQHQQHQQLHRHHGAPNSFAVASAPFPANAHQQSQPYHHHHNDAAQQHQYGHPPPPASGDGAAPKHSHSAPRGGSAGPQRSPPTGVAPVVKIGVHSLAVPPGVSFLATPPPPWQQVFGDAATTETSRSRSGDGQASGERRRSDAGSAQQRSPGSTTPSQ